MSSTPLEDLARLALNGDRDAVERLVRELQGDVYGLALRMLWNREDAEDATQEILARAVTRLSQFDFRSTLKTWVYRIAVNYILDVKKSRVEGMHFNFQRFGDDLVEGLSSDGPADVERSLLVEEITPVRVVRPSPSVGNVFARRCKPDSIGILGPEIGRVQRFCCRNRMVGPPSSWSLKTKEDVRDGPQPRSVRDRPRETSFSYASSKTHSRTTANRDSPECLQHPNAHLSGTRRTRNSPVLRQRWSASR